MRRTEQTTAQHRIVRVARRQNDPQSRMNFGELARELAAAHTRHHQVGHDDVDCPRAVRGDPDPAAAFSASSTW